MNPTYTRLHKCDPRRRQHRYYVLDVQPHLFGGWSLIREWGRVGQPGRFKIDLCDSLDDASRAYLAFEEQRSKKWRYPVQFIGHLNHKRVGVRWRASEIRHPV